MMDGIGVNVTLDLFGPEWGPALEKARAEEGDQAHARRTDPRTSHEAAAEVSQDLSNRQLCVLRCFQLIRMLDHETKLADVEWIPIYHNRAKDRGWIPQGDSSLRTRRAELVKAEKLAPAGERRIGKTNHTLWRLTDG